MVGSWVETPPRGLIEFKIEVPKKLTSKQEKLLREFAAELGEGTPKRKRKS